MQRGSYTEDPRGPPQYEPPDNLVDAALAQPHPEVGDILKFSKVSDGEKRLITLLEEISVTMRQIQGDVGRILVEAWMVRAQGSVTKDLSLTQTGGEAQKRVMFMQDTDPMGLYTTSPNFAADSTGNELTFDSSEPDYLNNSDRPTFQINPEGGGIIVLPAEEGEAIARPRDASPHPKKANMGKRANAKKSFKAANNKNHPSSEIAVPSVATGEGK